MDTPSDEHISPAVTQAGDATLLLHDLFAFVTALQREPAALRRDGLLTKADMLRLDEGLLVREELVRVRDESQAGRLAFLDFMARGVGLVLKRKGQLVLSADAGQWLSRSMAQQVAALWACWRDATAWDDLRRVRSLRVEAPASARHDPAAARRRALAALVPAGLQGPDTWVALSDVVRAVRERDPAFLRDPAQPARWTIADAATGRDLAPSRYWDLVEGALLRYLLTGPLHWLGLISLGYTQCPVDDADGALAFCALTPLGAYLLGESQVPWSPPAREPLVIQPNFEVLAPFHADPGAVLRLEQLAEPVQAGPARVYRLTRDRFRAALDAGADADTLLRFLEQTSDAALPQNVTYTLREWAGQYGRVRLEPATLLRTPAGDEPLMQELRAARRIAPLLDEALSPTVSTVAPENVAALAARLREDGFMPRVESAVDEPAPAARLHLAEREVVPLLAAAYVLAHLTERRGAKAEVKDVAALVALAARLERRLSPTARAQAEHQAHDWLRDLR